MNRAGRQRGIDALLTQRDQHIGAAGGAQFGDGCFDCGIAIQTGSAQSRQHGGLDFIRNQVVHLSQQIGRQGLCWRWIQHNNLAKFVRQLDRMTNRGQRRFQLQHDDARLLDQAACVVDMGRTQRVVGAGGQYDTVLPAGIDQDRRHA